MQFLPKAARGLPDSDLVVLGVTGKSAARA
jgi:hypothetical protein